MNNKSATAFLIIGFITAWFGVILELYLTILNRVMPLIPAIIKFFSYFTILTNILVAVTFTVLLFKKPTWLQKELNKASSFTAILVYILVVCLVYNFVLRPAMQPLQGLKLLANEILHSFIPIYFLIFWVVFVDKSTLAYKQATSWLVYPLIYVIYIFIRGAITQQYPYFFINVNTFGYPTALLNSLILFIVFLLFFYFFIWIGKLIAKREKN
jgi:hypothetical protein